MSSYAFVNPVVALGLAWLVGDGELSPRTGVAAVLVVAAVIFTRPTAAKRAESDDPETWEGTTLERAIPALRGGARVDYPRRFRADGDAVSPRSK